MERLFSFPREDLGLVFGLDVQLRLKILYIGIFFR